VVAGAHLSEKFGMTVRAIEADGFGIGDRVEMVPTSDTAAGVGRAMGEGLVQFARSYERRRPDLLLVMGDRFEMHAAVSAAAPFGIPVAHIHGGESTEGAMDELFRHAITKMSHLHFVANREARRRVIQMGEEACRVVVTGAPALDNLRAMHFLSKTDLAERIGIPLDPAPLLVTYHPVTLEWRRTSSQIHELLRALKREARPIIFTYPNADMGSDTISQAIKAFVAGRDHCRFIKNLGPQLLYSLMRHVIAMVGNSSSGIIEAASFKLPVVNIGSRQQGRLRGANVIDVRCQARAITAAVRRASAPALRAKLANLKNPYGDGHAAERIVRILKRVPLVPKLIHKRFVDLPS
jgi:UDP-hydrolysing UDP-N-acetyl-D-glucosamine 2-epimerase